MEILVSFSAINKFGDRGLFTREYWLRHANDCKKQMYTCTEHVFVLKVYIFITIDSGKKRACFHISCQLIVQERETLNRSPTSEHFGSPLAKKQNNTQYLHGDHRR